MPTHARQKPCFQDQKINQKLSSHPKGTWKGNQQKRPKCRSGKNTTRGSDHCDRPMIVRCG